MVAIRLARIGSKKRPYYRIVVIEKRRARNGWSLEVLGQYNPIVNPAEIHINPERALYWLSKGAEPSETVGEHSPQEGDRESIIPLLGLLESKVSH